MPRTGQQGTAALTQARATFATLRSGRCTDVLVAFVLVLVAAVAGSLLRDGSTLRLVVALPILLLVPGYLLLQALSARLHEPPKRRLQFLLSFGLSPPLVGLMALATAIVPGGFQSRPIMISVTVGCLLLVIAAAYLRVPPHLPATQAASPRGADATWNRRAEWTTSLSHPGAPRP